MKKYILFLGILMNVTYLGFCADASTQNVKTMPVQVEDNDKTAMTQDQAIDEARNFQKKARQFVQDSMNIWAGVDAPNNAWGRPLMQDGNLVKTDVKETPNDLIVSYDLPGVKKEDVKITLDRGILTIQGTRQDHESSSDKKEDTRYYTHERYQGSFVRSFTLPTSVQEDKIQAKMDNGVLTITIPKSQSSEAKVIPVR